MDEEKEFCDMAMDVIKAVQADLIEIGKGNKRKRETDISERISTLEGLLIKSMDELKFVNVYSDQLIGYPDARERIFGETDIALHIDALVESINTAYREKYKCKDFEFGIAPYYVWLKVKFSIPAILPPSKTPGRPVTKEYLTDLIKKRIRERILVEEKDLRDVREQKISEFISQKEGTRVLNVLQSKHALKNVCRL